MSNLPTVLAIETSTKACSVALIHKGQKYSRHEILPQKHAHRVLEMIDEILCESGLEREAIQLLAFGEGPGAFTGIRIASGVVQGLAIGLDVPVVAVSSLQAMVEEQLNEYQEQNAIEGRLVGFCAMLDARMSEVYQLLGTYDTVSDKYSLQPVSLTSPEMAAVRLAEFTESIDYELFTLGDIDGEYPQVIERMDTWMAALPNAVSIARLALRSYQKGKMIEDSIPKPVYLRNQVADTLEQRKQKASRQSGLTS